MAEEFGKRVVEDVMGGLGSMVLYIGMETGVWTAMDPRQGASPATSKQISEKVGLDPRYVEELLRTASVHGYLDYVPGIHDATTSGAYSGVPSDNGTFSLPASHAPSLCDKGTSAFLGQPLGILPRMAGHGTIPLVIDAFRSGEGVAFSRYGPEFVEYSCRSYAKEFEFEYGQDWMQRKEVSDIRDKLMEGGKIVLDIGSGSGLSSISLAKQFPHNRVLAVDPDETSTKRTEENIAKAESDGRIAPGEVTAHCCYASDAGCGPADLITIFRVVHDLADPVSLLKQAKGLLASHPAACVLVYEHPAPDQFSQAVTPKWKQTCRIGYTISLLHCLPVSMADSNDQKSAAIGTMVSEVTMRRLAMDAGFSSCSTVVRGSRGYLYRLNP